MMVLRQSTLFALVMSCSLLCNLPGLPAASAAPAARPAERKSDAPVYRIYPLRNGVCKIAGDHAFYGGDNAETYDYALYIWLILGGEKPMLVDAGLTNVAEMNKGAAGVLREPISQEPAESTRVQLRKFGLEPEDIGHIFITHLHFDHVDGLDDYPNATVHIGRKEWELATANEFRGSWGHGRIMGEFLNNPQWKKRLSLVGDEQVLPGIEAFWIGGHTPGSTAYRINTAHGRVVVTGDTISLLANLEKPVGVYSSVEEVKAAMAKVKQKADIVLPSHDPGTIGRWPPLPEGALRYTIRAIRVGECEVTNEITFQDAWGDNQGTRTYLLYVWLIEGGERPILVETGPNPLYVEAFNRSTAKYIPGGVKQKPEEDTIAALKAAGVDPGDISHVIMTHAHGDHYDYFAAFPQARLVVNRRELEDSFHAFPEDVLKALRSRPGVLQIVEDEEVVPGVRTVPLGCHTPGSQGVLVQTWMGPVLLTGDVVYMYDNIEQDRPGRSPSPQACLEAMARIRGLADIILPAHDPETLKRWPGGIIGGRPGARPAGGTAR